MGVGAIAAIAIVLAIAPGEEEPQAVIDPADPTWAHIEVAPEWLSPGVYLVEVETTEKSHFPLRARS